MFCLSRFCITCLQNNTNLVEVTRSKTIDSIGVKLSLCVTDVDWSFVKQFYMCTACIQLMELSFKFQQTCRKSAATLRIYIETLEKSNVENVKKSEQSINITLNKDDVPQEYVDEFNSRQVTSSSNIILPNNLYSFLTNTQFPIFNIIPSSTMVPGQSFINQVPPLMLINSVPSKPPQPDATTKEVNDILNSTVSEEVSVSVDPMAFNFNDDEEDNLLDIIKEEPENINKVINCKKPTCFHCNAVFDTRRALKVHRRQNEACFSARKTYFRKGSKSAQCHICHRKFCTQQYLQHHLELHQQKGDVHIGRRRVRKEKTEKLAPKPPKKLAPNNSKENVRNKNMKKRKITIKKKVTFSDEIKIIKDEPEKKEDSEDSLEVMCIEPEIIINLGPRDFNNDEHSLGSVENPLTAIEEIPLVSDKENLFDDQLTIAKNREEPILIDDDGNSEQQDQIGLLNGLRVKIVDGKPCCGYCAKLFTCLDSLQHHISTIHHDKMHFRCQFCKKRFIESHKLKDHLPQHYNYFLCKCCNESFTSVIDVQCHMIQNHDDFESTKCVSCAKDFATMVELKQHGDLHLKNLVFVCHVCNEKLIDSENFTAHVLQHYKLYTCLYCQIQFYSESEYTTHYETHKK